MISHIGLQPEGGHYTAYVHHPLVPSEWLCFDDSKVYVVSNEGVGNASLNNLWHNPNAYLLLYQREQLPN